MRANIQQLEQNTQRELSRWVKNPTNENEARLNTSEDKLAEARKGEAGRDFMCVPQIANDPFREEGETYAQALRDYIEFVVTEDKSEFGSPNVDPMDPEVIY